MEIADQVDHCVKALIGFKTPRAIRHELAERWGLPERTADRRIQAAREQMTRDVNEEQRQDVVARMMQQCLAIAEQAGETRQLSNAIGAMRLYGELLGVTGGNKL